jgi:NADH-quinone oxidoreductase subunit L
MLTGLFIAWRAYLSSPSIPARFVGQFGLLHAFLYNKWYFDELYALLFVRPASWLGRVFWKSGDERLIDRFGPDGAAAAVAVGTRISARIQTGYLYSYALVMLLGVAAATTWAMAQ